eukprot:gnl/Chilomastix_caulleri/3861.p2 GENE.gnl/Chilomastix_caulleri/3861~~gnl/Chilomastix_caulleri/3861.p2  ORF type:complete len:50 (-),score=2.25 gnl/Chilomastix_caulleri/3861:68-217(-)
MIEVNQKYSIFVSQHRIKSDYFEMVYLILKECYEKQINGFNPKWNHFFK